MTPLTISSLGESRAAILAAAGAVLAEAAPL